MKRDSQKVRARSRSVAWSKSLVFAPALTMAMAMAVGGCGSDDDDGLGVDAGVGNSGDLVVYVSSNGDSNRGAIRRLDGNFQPLAPAIDAVSGDFLAGNNEGIVVDIGGTLYQAGDVDAGSGVPGSIRVISTIRNRATGATSDVGMDRTIGGAGTTQTGLVNPKGIELAHGRGFILVADVGAGDVKVFGSSVSGDAPVYAQTTVAANPWDMVYDGVADRLFVALTDGTLAIFDNYFSGGFGPAGASRTVTPVDATGTKISVNLHGIAYDGATDRLVITDVGAANADQSPNFNADGQIFAFSSASTINGSVVPDVVVAGPSTQLGNPVDLIFNDGDVRIAEKANDVLLLFADIFSLSGDQAPTASVAYSKPESLAFEYVGSMAGTADVTDIDSTSIALGAIATSTNPGGALGDIRNSAPNLGAELASFDPGISVESLIFDWSGDAFVTFDDGNNQNGGVAVFNRLATGRNGQARADSRDRMITGPSTGLVSPKGLDIASDRGIVLVTENNENTPAILVFGTQSSGDVAPVYRTNLTGVGRPWDLDYDSQSDRLFVALTNGNVAVFDNYHSGRGAGAPARTITPASGGAQISVNLHGIIYDSANDRLFLSDVGSAADPNDGQLFMVTGAAAATGLAEVAFAIAGPQSRLGNPVDIAFDGANLYVAEKSNDVVMRFDDIANSVSGDIAASASAIRTKPESVVPVANYLSGRPAGVG